MIYLVPSRGVTADDDHALGALQALPVVLVQNLREGELRAEQKAFRALRVPRLTAGLAMPIVVDRLACPGPERRSLRQCVDLLRGVGLPTGWRNDAVDACADGRQQVRTAYASAFDEALRLRRADPLRTLAGLLSLEKSGDAAARVEKALGRAGHQASAMPDAARLRAAVEATAQTAVDQYNVQAARATVANSAERPPPLQLGDTYRQVRTDLIGTLGNIVADEKLGLTDSDREVLTTLAEQVAIDRLEMAVLGQFSAGKSTLINALLGTNLLTTGLQPTTGTVTRLVHGDEPGVDATWLDRVELTLLSDGPEHGEIRVHVEEMLALHEWLRTGEVAADACDFHPFGPGTAGNAAQMKAFLRLRDALGIATDAPHRWAYQGRTAATPRLPDGPMPGRVVVRKFTRDRPDWPGDLSVHEALDQAASPALALRVKEVHVAHPDPLLQHVTIIDTPGTDAPIPHHRAMAYGAVKDKPQCAVVYCFAGFKAQSRADRENIDFLREANVGANQLSRFFFTITQEGNVRVADRPGTRKYVVDGLYEVGLPVDRTYFVEVLDGLNDDFRLLLADLNEFVKGNKGPLVMNWIENAERIVDDVRARHESRLTVLASGEQARLDRARVLRAEAKALKKLRKDLGESTAWGEPYLRNRIDVSRTSEAADIDADIERLTDQNAFTDIDTDLDKGLEALNRWAHRAAEGACGATADKLRSEIADRLPGRTIGRPVIPPGDAYFPAKDVLAAARNQQWRGGWKKFWNWLDGTDWDADITRNRDRIAKEWRSSRHTGERRMSKHVTETIAQLSAELDRLAAGIAEELKQVAKPPAPENKQIATVGRDRTIDWAQRLRALSKTAAGGRP